MTNGTNIVMQKLRKIQTLQCVWVRNCGCVHMWLCALQCFSSYVSESGFTSSEHGHRWRQRRGLQQPGIYCTSIYQCSAATLVAIGALTIFILQFVLLSACVHSVELRQMPIELYIHIVLKSQLGYFWTSLTFLCRSETCVWWVFLFGVFKLTIYSQRSTELFDKIW